MSRLVISVRFHDGRYHGDGDWPPAPARLFQAFVAGAGLGGPLGNDSSEALAWLEKRGAPLIAAPAARRGHRLMFYMPNNDSDRVEGDPLRISEIRTARKVFSPYLFDSEIPFLYAWTLASTDEDDRCSRVVCSLGERLYQLGRGVDMAWAWGEVLDAQELDARLSVYPGRIYHPSSGKSTSRLACPCPGSLKSLKVRYMAYGKRFRIIGKGKSAKFEFRQAPRPRFRLIPYQSPSSSPPSMRFYELREPTRQGFFAPWPLVRASALVVQLRDGALDRLSGAIPARAAEIERVLVGRRPDGTNDGPIADRVRIVPLPSIGHTHADREIRRVLIEVPPTCPIPAEDVFWAFSGLDLVEVETGEVRAVVTPSVAGEEFGRHYGIGGDPSWRVWRTVTPAVLPEEASRRRIDPTRRVADAKPGPERVAEQARAAAAVTHALRHANVRTRAEVIRVQREPFEGNGARVEPFAERTRFGKERLWHVEVAFGAPVCGPLVMGDGRFLGLGVMAPLPKTHGIHAFLVESGFVGTPNPKDVARALRRAVMARVQEVLGDEPMPTFFSGHERAGSPARSYSGSHLAFVFDPTTSRLLIVAPHVLERREPSPQEKRRLTILEQAVENLRELRAGPAGRLLLRPDWIDVDTDALTAPSRTWESVTPYLVTRHAKKVNATEALSADMRAECRRRGLPEPFVTLLEMQGVPGVGLVGRARLEFNVAVHGPLLIGRSRHLGGGLFVAIGARVAQHKHAGVGAPHSS